MSENKKYPTHKSDYLNPSIPVISGKNLLYKKLCWTAVGLVILSFTLMFVEWHFKIESGLLRGIETVSLLAPLIGSWFLKSMKSYNQIGTLYFSPAKIIIDLNKQKTELLPADVTCLNFIYLGYEGENFYSVLPNPGSSLMVSGKPNWRSGRNNFIGITTLTSESKYEIFLENEVMLNKLREMLKKYHAAGITIQTNNTKLKNEISAVAELPSSGSKNNSSTQNKKNIFFKLKKNIEKSGMPLGAIGLIVYFLYLLIVQFFFNPDKKEDEIVVRKQEEENKSYEKTKIRNDSLLKIMAEQDAQANDFRKLNSTSLIIEKLFYHGSFDDRELEQLRNEDSVQYLNYYTVERNRIIDSITLSNADKSLGRYLDCSPLNSIFGIPSMDYETKFILKFENKSASDVVVCLEDIKTKKVIRNCFLLDSTFTFVYHIPIGEYTVKIIYGKNFLPGVFTTDWLHNEKIDSSGVTGYAILLGEKETIPVNSENFRTTETIIIKIKPYLKLPSKKKISRQVFSQKNFE